ncbi:hypothetical protein ALC57_10747 [Trachymyrmex cornetzi]|uniref:Uncharacterized protein n=1 Tax=Trachymyrmex cornetzi TaxID=471704 RepID=A0A151J3F0_9HYME|nr:hypothetical protein ALC57_10747 [Trachymyrmex cornetzi]
MQISPDSVLTLGEQRARYTAARRRQCCRRYENKPSELSWRLARWSVVAGRRTLSHLVPDSLYLPVPELPENHRTDSRIHGSPARSISLPWKPWERKPEEQKTETKRSGWLYKKETNLPLVGATALDADSKIWELLAVVSHEHYAPLCVNDATLHSGLVDLLICNHCACNPHLKQQASTKGTIREEYVRYLKERCLACLKIYASCETR